MRSDGTANQSQDLKHLLRAVQYIHDTIEHQKEHGDLSDVPKPATSTLTPFIHLENGKTDEG